MFPEGVVPLLSCKEERDCQELKEAERKKTGDIENQRYCDDMDDVEEHNIINQMEC